MTSMEQRVERIERVLADLLNRVNALNAEKGRPLMEVFGNDEQRPGSFVVVPEGTTLYPSLGEALRPSFDEEWLVERQRRMIRGGYPSRITPTSLKVYAASAKTMDGDPILSIERSENGDMVVCNQVGPATMTVFSTVAPACHAFDEAMGMLLYKSMRTGYNQGTP